MKLKILLILCLIAQFGFSQNENIENHIYKKGTFSMYWGWNRAAYNKSDITFKGRDYNFELMDVIAKDRQSPFNVKTYFSPTKMTIPQYNFRIGYFIKDHYQLSFGADHMKYVMEQYNTVKINGTISNSGTSYDGIYDNANIVLADTFLKFEHTDGLNYENFELRRFDILFQVKNFCFSANEGLGVGFLLPRTNTTLLNNPRYDEFHLAGFGTSVVLALNLTFFKYFFIQSEWKGGFISMPDIRTTMHKEDRASQHFLFSQYNVVFGANFRIPCKKNPKD